MRKTDDDRMHDAIKASLEMRAAGYNTQPQDAYDAIQYDEQIESEGEWDDED